MICVLEINSKHILMPVLHALGSHKDVLCLLTDFCWMCLGDWKTHGSEYYECSRYKENPDIVNQSQQAQAREALKKYLFYFERVSFD